MRLVHIGSALLAGVLALALAPSSAGAMAPSGPATAPSASPALSLAVPSYGAVTAGAPADDPAARGRLSYAPKRFVGGQALTFRGNLGVRGKRTIVLQHHMNRPGDQWTRVLGFRGKTNRDGSFSFKAPGPSMFGISYRVFAKGHPSPRVTMSAKTQDSVLWVAGRNRADAGNPGVAVAGRPFTISVDTAPDDLYRRPDTKGVPVFVGRTLTLQKRLAGGRWSTLRTTKVLKGGMGNFAGMRSSRGTTVYRVRQEAWTRGGSQIGWTPSFPTYIQVAGGRVEAQRIAGQLSQERLAAYLGAPAPEPQLSIPAGTSASTKYRWQPSLYDFAWERGEGLSSKPYRGTRRQGRWADYSDGTGRVSKHNGGLSLDSKRHNGPGRGDFGTTRATLHGNAMTYGRWETRLRLKTAENNARDYRVRVELVPERAGDYRCGRHNILVADVRAHGKQLAYGVKAGTQKWTASSRVGSLVNAAPALAVEVQRGHITWFVGGRPVGTVRDRAAVPGVPMTLRLSMVGDARREMNQTTVMSDWQRGFPADRGQEVRSGAPLKRSALGASCG